MTKPKLSGVAAEIREYALSLPQTTEDNPWGECAFKVKGKTFVFLGASDELSFSMKLPKTGFQALALGFAEPTGYALGRAGWVTFTPKGRVSGALKQQFFDWVLESYRAIAPAKIVRELDSGESTAAAPRARAKQKTNRPRAS